MRERESESEETSSCSFFFRFFFLRGESEERENSFSFLPTEARKARFPVDARSKFYQKRERELVARRERERAGREERERERDKIASERRGARDSERGRSVGRRRCRNFVTFFCFFLFSAAFRTRFLCFLSLSFFFRRALFPTPRSHARNVLCTRSRARRERQSADAEAQQVSTAGTP